LTKQRSVRIEMVPYQEDDDPKGCSRNATILAGLPRNIRRHELRLIEPLAARQRAMFPYAMIRLILLARPAGNGRPIECSRRTATPPAPANTRKASSVDSVVTS
jgi:hypothetical protein